MQYIAIETYKNINYCHYPQTLGVSLSPTSRRSTQEEHVVSLVNRLGGQNILYIFYLCYLALGHVIGFVMIVPKLQNRILNSLI